MSFVQLPTHGYGGSDSAATRHSNIQLERTLGMRSPAKMCTSLHGFSIQGMPNLDDSAPNTCAVLMKPSCAEQMSESPADCKYLGGCCKGHSLPGHAGTRAELQGKCWGCCLCPKGGAEAQACCRFELQTNFADETAKGQRGKELRVLQSLELWEGDTMCQPKFHESVDHCTFLLEPLQTCGHQSPIF